MNHPRLLVAFGGFLVIVSVGGFFIVDSFMKFVNLDINFLALVAAPFLGGAALLMYGYLRGGTSPQTGIGSERIVEELARLHERIEELNARAPEASSSPLSADQQNEVFETIKAKAEAAVTDQILEELEDRYSEQTGEAREARELNELCVRTERRLRQEIEALSRRGNVNLVIGVLTSLIAVGILASTVMFEKTPPDLLQLTTHFLPRVTLSLFIEVFSFFFLRLYSASLSEIKYFQNELTNVESKFIALRRAAKASDKATMSKLLQAIAGTERNFILKKGETTADLERAKLDSTQNKELLSLITQLTKQQKRGNET